MQSLEYEGLLTVVSVTQGIQPISLDDWLALPSPYFLLLSEDVYL